MRVLQGPTSHYSDINSKFIEQTLQGKWHQLKPRAFIAKADGKFLAVTFNCFERLASAFLKIIKIDYFKHILKAKEFRMINPRKEKLQTPPIQQPRKSDSGNALPDNTPAEKSFQQRGKANSNIPQKPAPAVRQRGNANPTLAAQKSADYDIDKAIDQVRRQADEITRLNKKHCLFLCRGSQQSVPQNADEVWVSLDNEDGGKYTAPTDPSRIHLHMSINDDQRLFKLARLFDKVILDQASFNTIAAVQPWMHLSGLLKKSPHAELITETHRYMSPKLYRSEEELRLESNAPRLTTRELFVNEREAFVSYPIVANWDAARNATAKREAEEASLIKTQQYLQQMLFTTVDLKRQQPFPCQERLVDHFVMKGPIK